MKSWTKPTPDIVDKAVAKLALVGTQRYFYERLENPEWLEPLKKRECFKNPPAPLRDDAKGTISFPTWPAATYLQRMAREQPEQVVAIIKEIPASENIQVQTELIEIALQLPPKLAADISFRFKSEIGPFMGMSLLPYKLQELIVYLAENGEDKAAFVLAEIIFQITATEKPSKPRTWLSEWHYDDTLKKCLPALIKANAGRALEMMCNLLFDVIKVDSGPPNDYSYVARESIGGQSEYASLEGALINAVRDTALQLAQSNEDDISRILQSLNSRKWWIFQRISLFVLGEVKPYGSELVAEYLLNRTLFDEHHCKQEYFSLLEKRFDDLAPEQQDIILGWIQAGPDLEKMKNNFQKIHGEFPEDTLLQNHRKFWIRDKLIGLGKSLPATLLPIKEELIAEFGMPEPRMTTWIGPISPKTADELNIMAIQEIIDYLKSWEPSTDYRAPTPEGLGRELDNIIKQRLPEFATSALLFKGVRPTYLRHLIWSLGDAAAQSAFDWKPIIELCEWVIGLPVIPDEDGDSFFAEDQGWNGTRQAIARLFNAGFKSKTNTIPTEYREKVWDILVHLTNDPDPSPELEARQNDDTGMGASTLSINTVRGDAMHAVIQYMLWIGRQVEEKQGTASGMGFKIIPEVQEVLDKHLDPSIDPSVAIRSVYGQWFPWLVMVDKEWAKKAAELIFPSEEKMRHFWSAAWGTYIQYVGAYNEVLEVIETKYVLAIERLPSESEKKRERYEDHLGSHLMTFYWRGLIELSTEGLINQFMQKASPKGRGKTMDFVGRSLANTTDAISEDILERIKTLWEWRFSLAKQEKELENYRSELESFGFWFMSGKFEDTWSLKQLLEVITLTKGLRFSYPVIQRLTHLAVDHPYEVIQCLQLLLIGDNDNSRFISNRPDAESILKNALQSKNTLARDAAIQLIHSLGAMGHMELGKLLTAQT